ncbi:MAG: hypothetical protein E2590_16440 [Chryseobacterium sp.]|nr:hypothetical protein [Chryseobacterium sp.]
MLAVKADKEDYYPNTKYYMETKTDNISEEIPQDAIYSIDWEDIENVDLDYGYDLDEIENFFREDFENDIIY